MTGPEQESGSEASACAFMLQGWRAMHAPNFKYGGFGKLASDKPFPFKCDADRKPSLPVRDDRARANARKPDRKTTEVAA